MTKTEVLNIIDEVMNNREIDSIRNAILAIRDKVIEFPDEESNTDLTKDYVAKLKLRNNSELSQLGDYFKGAEYICIDTSYKIDSGIYGAFWYE